MAGEWLKIEKDTPEKPEILLIAELLGISQGDAFLACFKFWKWADSQTVDGCAVRLSPTLLDALCGLRGFADALREVGWLQVRDGSLAIPNFSRHMGQPAKARILAAARMQRLRTPANGTAQHQRNISATEPSPEKRREEKTKEGPVFEKRKIFKRPTVEEVSAYCRERGNSIDASIFVDHYESKGWKIGKTPMKDWRAAVRTWERNAPAKQRVLTADELADWRLPQ